MPAGPTPLGVCHVVGVNSHELSASVLLGRWASAVDLFGRVWWEGGRVGYEEERE